MHDKRPLSEGEQRKAEAHTNLQTHREALIHQARRVFVRLLLERPGGLTTDAIRAELDLPEGIDPRWMGAVPGSLARRKIIRAAGYQPSDRAEAHARPMRVWELADRSKAEQWLRDHPDRDGSDEPRVDAVTPPEPPRPFPGPPSSTAQLPLPF